MIADAIREFASKIGGELSVKIPVEAWDKFATEIDQVYEVAHPFVMIKKDVYQVNVSKFNGEN